MTCTCKEHDQSDTARTHAETTLPTAVCLYCAEKHIATAAALAREQGYSGTNRGFVIGELVAACWHLSPACDPAARDLSSALRDFRHRIQSREEDEACTDFSPYLQAIDNLIRKESAT